MPVFARFWDVVSVYEFKFSFLSVKIQCKMLMFTLKHFFFKRHTDKRQSRSEFEKKCRWFWISRRSVHVWLLYLEVNKFCYLLYQFLINSHICDDMENTRIFCAHLRPYDGAWQSSEQLWPKYPPGHTIDNN